MAKKKVTAPVSYDPGKGRPKEHLAYLNYQEMQALRRLNGNNTEKGPRGLPSFPPADAQGSSSKASSSKTSSKSSGSSSVSRISGGTSGSNAASSASRAASSSRNSPASYGGGGRDSGQAAARSKTTTPSGSRGSPQKSAENLIRDLGKKYNLPEYSSQGNVYNKPLPPSGGLSSLDKSYYEQVSDFLNRTFYGDDREGLRRVENIGNTLSNTLMGVPLPAKVLAGAGQALSYLKPSYLNFIPASAGQKALQNAAYFQKTIDEAAPYLSGQKVSVPDFGSLPRYSSLARHREAVEFANKPSTKAMDTYYKLQSKLDDIARTFPGDFQGKDKVGRAAMSAQLGLLTNTAYDKYSDLNRQQYKESRKNGKVPMSNDDLKYEKGDFDGISLKGDFDGISMKDDFGGSGMKAGGAVKGSKGKVAAPLSYDPGKGRPKEYLAYLNYQEMEALKRLNGNNIERGPKGIPSYAAFAGTSGTGYSSGYKGTTTSKPSSSVSRISGGTAGSNTARASSSGSGFSNLGGGGRDSGQAAARQTATSRFADSTKSNAPSVTSNVTRGASSAPRGNAEATLRAYEESMRAPVRVPNSNLGLSYSYNNIRPTGVYPGNYMYNPTTQRLPGVKVPRASIVIPQNPPVYTPPPAPKIEKIQDRVPQFLRPLAGSTSTKGISDLGYGEGIEDDMVPGPRIDPSTGRPYGDVNFRIGEVSTVPSTPVTMQRSYFEDLVQKGVPTPSRSYFGDINKRSITTPSRSYFGDVSKKSTQERILKIETVPEEDFPTNTSEGKAFANPFTDRLRAEILPNAPMNSLVEDFPNRSAVYMTREIAPPPSFPQPETNQNTANSAISMLNPTMGERMDRGSAPYQLTRAERIAMDNLLAGRVVPAANNIPIPRLRPEGIGTSSTYEGSEPPTDEDITGQGGSPSQEDAAPSQDFTVTPEAEAAQEAARVKAERARRAGGAALNLFAPPFGTIIGQGIKFADAQMQKLVDRYQSSGMEERKVLEDKYPNLIPRAQAMGIQSYYGMDKYRDWADKAGLRAPPSREGGKETSGIEAISPRPPRDEESNPRPSTSSGGRPEIYYMWDLGIKIPSPGDPNYTQYQTYLAERLAAQ